MDMVKYKESKSSIGVVVITAIFAVIAAIFIMIGAGNEVLGWLKTTGVVLLVISVPVLFFFLYQKIMKKIKEM